MNSARRNLLLGVDVGTTSTKAAVFDEGGAEISRAAVATPLRWFGEGVCDQEPEQLHGACVRAICLCLEHVDGREVQGLAFAGQMAGVMGIDADWNPSTPYDSWLDTRCAPDVSFLRAEAGPQLVALTGCPPMVNHGPKMRWWKRHHPEAYKRTHKFLMPAAYVAGKLAGLRGDDGFIDRTYLHFTAVADTQRGVWSQDLLDILALPLQKLPQIVQPSTVIGRLTRAAAQACGLPAGTPIAAGLGDTAAAALGAGVVKPGDGLDIAGTASVFAAGSREFRADTQHETLITMAGAADRQWISLAYLSGGDLLSWFGAATTIPSSTEQIEQPQDMYQLSPEVEAVPPGSLGLVFIPHLDGRILPSAPSMRGAWVGLRRDHRHVHLQRAILESIAYEYSGYLRIIEDLHPSHPVESVRVVGGGARSRIWNDIKASVLGKRYERLDREEPGCWGAALVAGQAVGLFPDVALAASRTSEVQVVHQPDLAAFESYRRMVSRFGTVTGSLSSLFQEMADAPSACGAGDA